MKQEQGATGGKEPVKQEQGVTGGREQVKQEPKVNLPFDAGNTVPRWKEDQNLWDIPTLVKNQEKR